MNPVRRLMWLLMGGIAALALTSTLHSFAQESENIQVLGVNTNNHPRLEITVSVFDPAGRPLNGLQAANFAVFEDDKAVAIKSVTSITDESIPLGIVLVMDTSTSMDEVPLSKAKAAALAFVDQVRPIDELALISFNSTVKELQPMTKDHAVIKAKISELTSAGQTALYDTIAQAVKTAQTSTAKRRVIILLTDGNEYGNLSKIGGVDAYKAANKAGIPVFAIGLGFDIDANYLRAVTDNTGGAFYESPSAADLGKVYGQIGTVLRSLYVLSIDTGLPADGGTHRIRVEFHAEGATGSAQDNARYPAPIPVVRLSGIDPTVPLDKTATVEPEVVADNKLTGYEYQIDGKTAASGDGEPKSLDVDPIKLLPGAHSLTLSVSDDKNHTGQGKLNFQVAALPPEFTIEGLKTGETISADRAVTLKVGDSQTAVGAATFDIDGTVLSTVQQAPYSVTLNVLSLTAGKHTFTAQLKNAGATGKQSVDFTISPAPYLTATASAVRQATRNAQATLTAMPTRTNTPTNTAVPPTKTITSTNTAVPPSATTNLTATAQAIALAATDTPAPSDTPTNTPQATDTVAPSATSSATSTPRPTDTPVPSATRTDTPAPTATLTPSATLTATPTLTPSATATATPTGTATSTATPLRTATPTSPLGGLGSLTSNPAVLLCGGLLILLVIIIMVLTGARRSPRRLS
jgi:VWFA-related protein